MYMHFFILVERISGLYYLDLVKFEVYCQHVNLLALTATTTRTLRIDVARLVGVRNEKVISLFPCKSNITYAVIPLVSFLDSFSNIVEWLQNERTIFPRMIVYCRRFEDCANLYLHFKNELKGNFTKSPILLIYPSSGLWTCI